MQTGFRIEAPIPFRMKPRIAFHSFNLPQLMRSLLVFPLCCALMIIGCRKRKVEPIAPAETVNQPEAVQVSAPVTSTATQPLAKQVDIPGIEAGVEFGDLNNIIAGFEYTHKRLPTGEELKKLYYGGTRPIPMPPGYKLVVDPKTKRAKLAPGN